MYQYSSERVNTDRLDVDDIERIDSLDVRNFDILMEDGDRVLLEYTSNSSMMLEIFNIENIDDAAQNDAFSLAADGVLDFSEKNPFGEYR